MSRPRVWLLTENLPERRFLEAIFADRRAAGDVAVRDYLVRSAAIGMAKLSLLEQPELPLALVFNTQTEDPIEIEEQRGTLQRILAACALQGWHVALAAPRINAWALADPWIKQQFEDRPETDPRRQDQGMYYNQAIRIGELVQRRPFDVEALKAVSPEFRSLNKFIDQHVSAAKKAVTAGAS